MPTVDPAVLDKIRGEILAAASRRSVALADVIRFDNARDASQDKVDHEEHSIQLGRNFLMTLGLDPDAILRGEYPAA